MLGRGLESLIPAGGYKKQDDPSTSSGQALLTSSGQAPSTSSGQAPLTSSGQAPSTDLGQFASGSQGQGLPVVSGPNYPAGLGQAFSMKSDQAFVANALQSDYGQVSTFAGQGILAENQIPPSSYSSQASYQPSITPSMYPGGYQSFPQPTPIAPQPAAGPVVSYQQYSPKDESLSAPSPSYEHLFPISPATSSQPMIQEREVNSITAIPQPAPIELRQSSTISSQQTSPEYPLSARPEQSFTNNLEQSFAVSPEYNSLINTGNVPVPGETSQERIRSVDNFQALSASSALQYGDLEEDYSKGQASVFQIEVEKIFSNPHQPRRHFDQDALNELANSIREFGIIQPLIVTKTLKETERGTDVAYQLIAGERRLMAAKKVGLRTVPVVIKRVGMDRERLELAIIENIQREDLNPLEAARSYARLQDEFGLTQREIAIRMGKSRETIANALRLLNLSSDIQQALESGRINESHARLLLQINDISRQKDMFQSILRAKPSVRELKATIKREKTGLSRSYLNPELISLQTKLEEFLGTKAKIDDNGGEGKITINYYSPEELSTLISRLSGEDF